MAVFIFNQTNLKTQITDLKIDLLIIKSYKKRGVVTMYCKQCGNFIDENKVSVISLMDDVVEEVDAKELY